MISVLLENIYTDNLKYVTDKQKRESMVVGKIISWPTLETQLHSENELQLKPKKTYSKKKM